VERLFTRDYYELVKSRLAPGGVYAQWLQIYEISPETAGMVFRTFSESFAHVHVFGTGRADIILVGSTDDLNPKAFERMRSLFTIRSVRDDLASAGVSNLTAFLGHEIFIDAGIFRESPLHTLDRPRLAFSAGRDVFFGSTLDLDSILGLLFNRPWVHAAARRSVLASALHERELRGEFLAAAAVATCNRTVPGFFAGWAETAHPCPQLLAAAGVEGVIAPGFGFDARLKSDLERLKGTPPLELSGDPEQASRLIDLYGVFDSFPLPLDASVVVRAAEVCARLENKRGFSCRARAVEALARSGHGRMAKAALDNLVQDARGQLPAEVLLRLSRLVGEALAVDEIERQIPGSASGSATR
jgi:hypothetical protein